MCSMSEQEKCTVDGKLDALSKRFDELEKLVKSQMSRLDSHERLVRLGKNALLLVTGAALGAGLINLKVIGQIIALM